MIINLFKPTEMRSLSLPQKVKGQYWLLDQDENGDVIKLIGIEARDGIWIIKSNETASIIDRDSNVQKEVALVNQLFLDVKVQGQKEPFVLFSEEQDRTRQTLKKIQVTEPFVFSIGRDPNNHLRFDNPFVSAVHAKIAYDGEQWSVSDAGSTNGTFVNGARVVNRKLIPGDLIYIMGLKIVIGSDFFAINNPDEKLKIKSDSLALFTVSNYVPRDKTVHTGKEFFSRAPRFRREIVHEEITIDPPPAAQKPETVPLALMLGPSLTMGMASIGSGVLSAISIFSSGGSFTQALPMLIMSFSMLLGTVLWPILTKQYEKKQRKKLEKTRQEKYLEYLSEVGNRIKMIGQEQSNILNENLVTPQECADRVLKERSDLWDRVTGQPDFLVLRLGVGDVPMDIGVKYQEKKFSLDDDDLQDAMIALAEAPKTLRNIPISISLQGYSAVGIYGNHMEIANMVRILLIQLMSLHSYDEVKIMLLTDETETEEWGFVKYIPHFWNNEKTVRFFVTSPEEAKEMTAHIESMILSRSGSSEGRSADKIPYYVIICMDKTLARKCEGVRMILESGENLGCTLIFGYERMEELPKETSRVILANGDDSALLFREDVHGAKVPFFADRVERCVLKDVCRKMAGIELELSGKGYVLPNMLTFLELFNVGRVEHLNSLSRWKKNNPVQTLQTPVGMDSYGDPFILDLHEKFHGPHGLVAGMTGSGKSEFLITYILSLAVNYHPDEVAFVLIDYKGGGLAGAFENKEKGIKLPHLAGVITNLDGAALNRMLVSFQSERRRRESIFIQARTIANEGTMDIYRYQRLYREKLVSEPLPHLFIIADEFAELKVQQAEFMEQLISLARVGRSLGIHLILATQKPSGVVDDQIWSNSKFRVCLKVQERADSQDMIKRPDAAEISQTGRFYLQVGFNELFAMGQSAWCGADYIPAETADKAQDETVQVIDNLGRVIMNMKPPKKDLGYKPIKQVVAIVNYLSALAEEEKVGAKSLWLDAIPERIYLSELEKKYQYSSQKFVLNPAVGEYDDPFNQRQGLLTIPFSMEGNCLVYGSVGSGKTKFITTLVYSLLEHHCAEELNLYLLDFGSGSLKAFEKAPQVGDVITATEEEKLTNFLKMLRKEVDYRKACFSEYGGNYAEYIRSAQKTVPNILVVLQNYSAFSEVYEDLQDEFTILSRDGLKYGIYFLVTAETTNAVRYRTQQNFKMILCLQLNDPSEYPILLGKTDGLVPAKCKGRGLAVLDKVYEFQAAYLSDESELMDLLRNKCREWTERDSGKARRVPILPGIVDYDFVFSAIQGIKAVPIGVEKKELEIATVNLGDKVLYPILGLDILSLAPFTEEFIRVCRDIVPVEVVDAERTLKEGLSTVPMEQYEEYVRELFQEMVERHNHYIDSRLDPKSLNEYREKVVVISGFRRFVERLSEDGKDKLFTLIDKAESFYKIHFAVFESEKQFELVSDRRIRGKANGEEGLWIGNGINYQSVLDTSRMLGLEDEIGAEFGYQVERGRLVLVKVLSGKEM